MNKIYFTCGPTQISPFTKQKIKKALQENICSISHRGNKFSALFRNAVDGLTKLFNLPNNYCVFFTSSATECMEIIISNLVREKSFHFVNGAFSSRFFEEALCLGKNAEKKEVEYGQGIDIGSVKIPADSELVCFTHNETSTGVSLSLGEIYKLKRKHPNKLLAVDIVSSAPCLDLNFSLIDCAFFSVQKGFGLPAGLGVLMVNKKCLDRANKLKNNLFGLTRSLARILGKYEKCQTIQTPNMLGIYLLGEMCAMYNRIGIENILRQTRVKANYLYKYFDSHNLFSPFVSSAFRSLTTLAIQSKIDSQIVVDYLGKKGFVLGGGYGQYKNSQFRIANFPMHSLQQVKDLVACFDYFV